MKMQYYGPYEPRYQCRDKLDEHTMPLYANVHIHSEISSCHILSYEAICTFQ